MLNRRALFGLPLAAFPLAADGLPQARRREYLLGAFATVVRAVVR